MFSNTFRLYAEPALLKLKPSYVSSKFKVTTCSQNKLRVTSHSNYMKHYCGGFGVGNFCLNFKPPQVGIWAEPITNS